MPTAEASKQRLLRIQRATEAGPADKTGPFASTRGPKPRTRTIPLKPAKPTRSPR